MSARQFGAMLPRCFHAIDNFFLLLTQHLSVLSNHAENSYTNGRPGVLTPKAAHAANGGHGIETTLAVPGKVALIVAVADVHIG